MVTAAALPLSATASTCAVALLIVGSATSCAQREDSLAERYFRIGQSFARCWDQAKYAWLRPNGLDGGGPEFLPIPDKSRDWHEGLLLLSPKRLWRIPVGTRGPRGGPSEVAYVETVLPELGRPMRLAFNAGGGGLGQDTYQVLLPKRDRPGPGGVYDSSPQYRTVTIEYIPVQAEPVRASHHQEALDAEMYRMAEGIFRMTPERWDEDSARQFTDSMKELVDIAVSEEVKKYGKGRLEVLLREREARAQQLKKGR